MKPSSGRRAPWSGVDPVPGRHEDRQQPRPEQIGRGASGPASDRGLDLRQRPLDPELRLLGARRARDCDARRHAGRAAAAASSRDPQPASGSASIGMTASSTGSRKRSASAGEPVQRRARSDRVVIAQPEPDRPAAAPASVEFRAEIVRQLRSRRLAPARSRGDHAKPGSRGCDRPSRSMPSRGG